MVNLLPSGRALIWNRGTLNSHRRHFVSCACRGTQILDRQMPGRRTAVFLVSFRKAIKRDLRSERLCMQRKRCERKAIKIQINIDGVSVERKRKMAKNESLKNLLKSHRVFFRQLYCCFIVRD
jgi:hypothetical protein